MTANEVLKLRMVLAMVLLMSGITQVLAQVHKEEDGFQWIEFGEFDALGAKDLNGKIIVNPKWGCSQIQYCNAKQDNVSIGYFRIRKFEKNEFLEGICDMNGNVIIPMKYGFASMSLHVCGPDTLVHILTTDNNLETSDIYDCTGKKIAKGIPSYYIDDNGYICDFNTKENLNIKIPSANGKLANFYQRTPVEEVQTPLGLYAVQIKENEGFKWRFLYTSSLCGAQSMDGKVIIPVEKKCKEIEYDNGVFIAETADDVYCVYSKDGEEIIPTSYNYNHIYVDISTKTFLICSTKNVHGDTESSLHDFSGKLILTGIYSRITPQKVNDQFYFIVSKDKKSQVLDDSHNLLVSVDEPCFISDIYEDRLVRYYKILQSDIEKSNGIIDDNGKVVIAPGRYDLIKRIVNDKVAFYETTIIRGDKYSDQEFLIGICDLEGNEILPNEYEYSPYSDDEIFTMEKGGMKYEINVAQLIADAKVQRERKLAYNINRSQSNKSSQQFARSISSSHKRVNDVSKYQSLNDPNLLDNSKKIKQQEEIIRELEHKKKNCYYCHGTRTVSGGNCNVCRGTGVIKAGYYTPQFFTCNYCKGTGRKEVACMECQRTDLAISFANKLLEGYQKTHGMTKEAAKLYYEHEAWKAQSDRDYQNAINEIVESYLDDSGTSQGSTTSDSPCSMCHGTGIDPFPWKDAASNAGNGPFGYTNQSGHKCPYCDERVWHQHKRCPKCNVR